MDGTTAPRVRVSLLGQFRATVGDAEISLGGRRQRGVLVMLAVARGEFVPADTLIEGLWGDGPPADPLASLQSFVSRIRGALQPTALAGSRGDLLVSTPQGYALRLGAEDVDTWQFERLVREGSAQVDTDPATAERLLTEGLALWRGPAFPEYAHEPWAAAEAARLDGLRAAARERLFAVRLQTRDAGLLVADLQALVDEEPLREERWRLLVVALYRAHRQADALAALRRARQLLADELGVDPGPALRALEEQVLAQSPDLDVATPATPATGTVIDAPTFAAGDDLVERQRELRLLDACLTTAQSGTGCLAFVEGPAGIGKSRLLTEFRGRAAVSALVLHARASQLEQEFSFGVARQLL
ncbi:MAG: hypothetical protein JWM93_3792, partial [Frankiales bacterium]|nr:hypothetical protein [Frankiales bacterium]